MKRILILLVIVFAIWFYFTPHLAVKGMKAAIEARDASRLASYVDFPTLRQNLKTTLGDRLQTELKSNAASSGRDLAAALGAAMISTLMNPMIDALITPDGIARIMAGEQLAAPRPGRPNTPTAPAAPDSPPPATESTSHSDLSMSYESFDRFVATAKHRGVGEPGALIFTRDGWFSWKLTGIRLPR